MTKFNFNHNDFEKIKEEAEKFYQSIGAIHCPYFGQEIFFNAKGLRHLKFKSDQQARTNEEQYPRLKLLHLAPRVLQKSHTLQGIWTKKSFEVQKTNSQWSRLLKEVTFYEFMAVLDNVRIKVIVKEVHGGEKHFWSIIPYWSIDKERSKRMFYNGDPEHD